MVDHVLSRTLSFLNVLLFFSLGSSDDAFFAKRRRLHPECWAGDVQPERCCVPPNGRKICFPDGERFFTYSYCCEVSESEKQSELTDGGWLDTQYFRALTVDHDAHVEAPAQNGDLVGAASHPFVNTWFAEIGGDVSLAFAEESVDCNVLFSSVLHVSVQLKSRVTLTLQTAFKLQDAFVKDALLLNDVYRTMKSPNYRALVQPFISGHRFCLNVVEFFTTLTLLHGMRCVFHGLRTAFARVVSTVMDLSQVFMKLNFAVTYINRFDTRADGTQLRTFVEPLWEFYDKLAEVASCIGDVISALDPSKADRVTARGALAYQQASGAFSETNLLVRKVQDGWHLDHGLVASLVRFWSPQDSGARLSIADFGAGSGHYCAFLNKTEQYDCLAYDGASEIEAYTKGRVSHLRLDLPFDLGRTFDWAMSFEVAEHLPPDAAETFLRNLRRHVVNGIVLSWSEAHSDDVHPGALPRSAVQKLVEAHGFQLDSEATKQMRPVISWLRGAVLVFRAV
eukprot:TRINITY_DN22857_c0_g1_i1.p1 TRINITY_DN22857_c0_g1~~TRINITY_DN22857_c0_g1_i1.p1  ORF type:complete len:522 (-),score=73.66 TRINITY_DN22857_c0_g1_i1:106-1632(-)